MRKFARAGEWNCLSVFVVIQPEYVVGISLVFLNVIRRSCIFILSCILNVHGGHTVVDGGLLNKTMFIISPRKLRRTVSALLKHCTYRYIALWHEETVARGSHVVVLSVLYNKPAQAIAEVGRGGYRHILHILSRSSTRQRAVLDAVGNGNVVVGIVLRYDNTAVAVLGDGEVVGLAVGHVGLVVHIYHIGEVPDARCVNHFDAVVDGHGADCNSRTIIRISLAHAVSRTAACRRNSSAFNGDIAELYRG